MRPVPGVLGAAALGALALTCGVALTATSGWLIVSASFGPQILTLLAAIVLVRAFGMARPALRYAERLRSHDAALAHLAHERARVYAALVPLTPARLGRRRRGELLGGVVDDLDDLAFAQVRVIVPVTAAVVTIVLVAVVDAIVLLPAAPVVLSLLACSGVVGVADWWVERRAQRQVVAARARLTELAGLVGLQAGELRALGAQDTALSWVDTAQRELNSALRRQSWGRVIGVWLLPVVVIVHVAVMVAVVAPWVEQGMSTPLAAMLVLTPVALGEVVAVVPDAVGALARAQAASGRMRHLLAQTPAVHDPVGPDAATPQASSDPRPEPMTADAPGRPAASSQTACDVCGFTGFPGPLDLTLHGVEASWTGSRTDVAVPELSVPFGGTLGVVGANGSGKSTLLAVLARHLDPSRGRYVIGGIDVTTICLEHVRSQIAVVDDEPHVFASTLRENLRLARPDAGDTELADALDRAGLASWAAGLPDGLDTRLGTGGNGISGGERTRLGIARAVLSRRPIVLLDEPVAHLDHPTAVAVLHDLLAATSTRTVVLVSHRPEGMTQVGPILRLDRTAAQETARIEP